MVSRLQCIPGTVEGTLVPRQQQEVSEERRYLRRLPPQGKRHNRALYLLPGIAASARFQCFADTMVNIRTALLERVFYHEIGGVFVRPHVPLRATVDTTLQPFWRRLKRVARTLTPVPLLEYPATAYRGQKLALYQRAAEKVALRGSLRKDAYLGTFPKHEKLPAGKKRVVPRVIQPRAPEYNVEVGRYLHPLEHVLYQDVDRLFGGPTIMKGYNAFDQGRIVHNSWSQYYDPAAVGLDASRFDQHISVPLLEWEHRVYADLYYRNNPELKAKLRWQLDNVGYARCWDGSFKYRIQGGRCSGDMNTAMGNCLLMCAMVYTLLDREGMAQGSRRVRLLNNGDDCVLIGEHADILSLLPKISAFFTELGIIMKVERVVRRLEEVSFCQTQPIYDGTSWRMVREVRNSLTKDALILDSLHATRFLRNQLAAIGECGLALTGGMPILQSYYKALCRNGEKGGRVSAAFYDSGFYRLSKGLKARERVVTSEARVSFHAAFGITPDLQVALERYYDAWELSATLPPSLEAVEGATLI